MTNSDPSANSIILSNESVVNGGVGAQYMEAKNRDLLSDKLIFIAVNSIWPVSVSSVFICV